MTLTVSSQSSSVQQWEILWCVFVTNSVSGETHLFVYLFVCLHLSQDTFSAKKHWGSTFRFDSLRFTFCRKSSTFEESRTSSPSPTSVQPKFDWDLTAIFERFDFNCWLCDPPTKSGKTFEPQFNSSLTNSRTKVQPLLRVILDF
jgi:hypothetical protein